MYDACSLRDLIRFPSAVRAARELAHYRGYSRCGCKDEVEAGANHHGLYSTGGFISSPVLRILLRFVN